MAAIWSQFSVCADIRLRPDLVISKNFARRLFSDLPHSDLIQPFSSSLTSAG